MALYIPHSIFHLARLLYVRPETFGPYYVPTFNYERDHINKEHYLPPCFLSSVCVLLYESIRLHLPQCCNLQVRPPLAYLRRAHPRVFIDRLLTSRTPSPSSTPNAPDSAGGLQHR
jgi:hypothetical protein